MTILPSPSPLIPGESEAFWGFSDSAFFLDEQECLRMGGARYRLAAGGLPLARPWIEKHFGVNLTRESSQGSCYPPPVRNAQQSPETHEALSTILRSDQISADARVRLRCAHGHTLSEIWALHNTGFARIPDYVVFPEEANAVESLFSLARTRGLCLIPYGGGTNVSGALNCHSEEKRPIIAVAMGRMRRIYDLSLENMLVRIEAGASGQYIAEFLAQRGVTIGHEPDSMEFSTLGGWIASFASGMKKNRYGNIEDIVQDVFWISPQGRFVRPVSLPRESVGFDPRYLIFGSEGKLGIIVSACLRLRKLPERRLYYSLVFRNFERGYDFIRDLQDSGAVPASVRLVDNLQFQIGQVLRPETGSSFSSLLRFGQRFWVTRVKKFSVEEICACTLVFEGAPAETEWQKRVVFSLARRHGALSGGAENARRGYEMTFAIAYIRDFLLRYGILGESFETSIAWDKAQPLCRAVAESVSDEHKKRALPGKPVISYRITQLYQSGVTVYFYLGLVSRDVSDPVADFSAVEHRARAVILENGGALSHHHGVGQIRRCFLPQVFSDTKLRTDARIKEFLDPDRMLPAM